jgi:transposase
MSLIRRPVTEKQRAANRASARKSTGPKTLLGKQRASLNPTKHGLYSTLLRRQLRAIERGDEDLEEYQRLLTLRRQADDKQMANLWRQARKGSQVHASRFTDCIDPLTGEA